MVYPNITLRIKDDIPVILLNKSEDESYPTITSPYKLDDLIKNVATIISLEKSPEQLWKLAYEADPDFFEFPLPNGEMEDLSELTQLIKFIEDNAGKYVLPEGAENIDPQITAQLVENWQSDVIASFVEAVYNSVIMKTLLVANETGISDIILDDERGETRLREKMSKELNLAKLELIVVE